MKISLGHAHFIKGGANYNNEDGDWGVFDDDNDYDYDDDW